MTLFLSNYNCKIVCNHCKKTIDKARTKKQRKQTYHCCTECYDRGLAQGGAKATLTREFHREYTYPSGMMSSKYARMARY